MLFRFFWRIVRARSLALVGGARFAHRNCKTLRQAIFRTNPAFLAVIVPTLALLTAITQWQMPGRWFGFSPPPWFATLAAAALPLLLVWSLEVWLRTRIGAFVGGRNAH